MLIDLKIGELSHQDLGQMSNVMSITMTAMSDKNLKAYNRYPTMREQSQFCIAVNLFPSKYK